MDVAALDEKQRARTQHCATAIDAGEAFSPDHVEPLVCAAMAVAGPGLWPAAPRAIGQGLQHDVLHLPAFNHDKLLIYWTYFIYPVSLSLHQSAHFLGPAYRSQVTEFAPRPKCPQCPRLH